MMTHKHLFLMDPIARLNLKLDSSLRLCRALLARGQQIFFAEPTDLNWGSEAGRVTVKARALNFPQKSIDSVVLGREESLMLSSFAAVHMRKDPPFDLDYIATTWLLDTVADSVRIYNSPSALRSLNEKIAIFHFPEETRPAVVSCQPQVLYDFLEKEAQGDAVIKPLHLFGGKGVQRISLKEMTKAKAMAALDEATYGGKSWRLIQAFDQAIYEGEVRAFTAGGKAVSWCLKVPQKGQFLANTSAGAVLKSYEPKPEEAARVEIVASQLAAKGVFFVGFDLIGGYISEINITSPRLLQGTDDSKDYYAPIADWVVQDLDSYHGRPA